MIPASTDESQRGCTFEKCIPGLVNSFVMRPPSVVIRRDQTMAGHGQNVDSAAWFPSRPEAK